ncbi:MAG: hypothetical protein V4550_07375 [Gemmatimonadota bacterium]
MRATLSGLLCLALAAAAAPHAALRATSEPDELRRVWHDNGQLAEERGFVKGRENGTHRGWWPSGAVHFTYEYRDGVLDGVSREFYPSGALWRAQHYARGHEEGLQRLFWEDGRVRASYVVRGGRRFGLMGAKGCVTRADSLEAGIL